jgi:hypothetical protein
MGRGKVPFRDVLVNQSQSLVPAAPPLLDDLHLPVVWQPATGKRARSRVHPCRPNALTRTVDFCPKPTDRPHLLALPRPRSLRSSWHAAGLGSGGSLTMRTPSRRRTYASGAHPKIYSAFGTHVLFFLLRFKTVATIVSNRSTRRSAWKSDGNLCAKWALERTAL